MASKILTRSGRAVTQYANLLGFNPSLVVMVGVGVHHEEVDFMLYGDRQIEGFGDFELIGFEPNPNTYNAVVDKFPGKLYNAAVCEDYGIKQLFYKDRHKDGSSLFVPNNMEGVETCSVKAVSLDVTFGMGIRTKGVAEHYRALLWLDCEGSELRALKGGEEFVCGQVDLINVEMTGRPRGVNWARPIEVHRWLKDRGFKQAWIHTTRSSIGQFDAIYVRDSLFREDLCCCLDSLD